MELIEKIDVIGVVELVPVGNGGDGAAAALGEGGDDFSAKVGVEDFADADHEGHFKKSCAYWKPQSSQEKIVHQVH